MEAFENKKELNYFIYSNIHSFEDWIKIYKEQSSK
jgi:hypothetical protein